jgi:hypothetical protein
LGHGIALELVCEFVCGHLVLLASKITKQGVYKSRGYSAPLNYQSFRNVTFAHNTFHGVTQPTISPLLIEHVQNTAADTWVVDGAAYLPFASRARNVISVMPEGAVTNASNVAQYVQPYALPGQGAAGGQVHLKWPAAVKGRAHVTLRCDNPL